MTIHMACRLTGSFKLLQKNYNLPKHTNIPYVYHEMNLTSKDYTCYSESSYFSHPLCKRTM